MQEQKAIDQTSGGAQPKKDGGNVGQAGIPRNAGPSPHGGSKKKGKPRKKGDPPIDFEFFEGLNLLISGPDARRIVDARANSRGLSACISGFVRALDALLIEVCADSSAFELCQFFKYFLEAISRDLQRIGDGLDDVPIY